MIRVLTLILLAFSPAMVPDQGGSLHCRPEHQVPIDRWRGEYFGNKTLSGAPVMVRDDGSGELRFDWGLESPSPGCGLKPDQFSARWTRKATFAGGVFRFTLIADDGVRLSIDGTVRIDDWRDRNAARRTADVVLDPGNHLIELEYYENFGSALIDLSWRRHPCFDNVPPDHWKAEYFEGDGFDAQPVAVIDEGQGPLYQSRISGNCVRDDRSYSIRWTRRTLFNAGKYRFSLISDGSAKLIVDGKSIIDRTNATPPAGQAADLTLTPGNHTVILEFTRKPGSSGARLDWRWMG